MKITSCIRAANAKPIAHVRTVRCVRDSRPHPTAAVISGPGVGAPSAAVISGPGVGAPSAAVIAPVRCPSTGAAERSPDEIFGFWQPGLQ